MLSLYLLTTSLPTFFRSIFVLQLNQLTRLCSLTSFFFRYISRGIEGIGVLFSIPDQPIAAPGGQPTSTWTKSCRKRSPHNHYIPGWHISLHVDVHAIKEAFDGVGGWKEEVGQIVAHCADEQQLAQGFPDTARPG